MDTKRPEECWWLRMEEYNTACRKKNRPSLRPRKNRTENLRQTCPRPPRHANERIHCDNRPCTEKTKHGRDETRPEENFIHNDNRRIFFMEHPKHMAEEERSNAVIKWVRQKKILHAMDGERLRYLLRFRLRSHAYCNHTVSHTLPEFRKFH